MIRARLFQLALLWLIVSAMVWLTTIWRWQNQSAEVGTSDILLQLILLPALLAGVLGGAIWAVGHARRQAAAPIAAKPVSRAASGSAASSAAADPLDTGAGLASAVVLAERIRLSAGDDPAQALEALASFSVRPGLDPELQDVDGMPVFSARYPELDVDSWRDAAQVDPPAGALPWLTEAVRALALLQPVLQEALDALQTEAGPDSAGWQAWLQRGHAARASAGGATDVAPAQPEPPSHLSGVARPEAPAAQLARKAQAPVLHVRLVLPPWPGEQREQAVAWVKSQCGALLDWAEAMSARGVNWLVEPLRQNEDIWTDVDQMLVRWQREGRPELLLLLAADSALTPQVIERMQARGELFTAQHQIGRMPGEAAVALLLGTPHWLGLASGESASTDAQAGIDAEAVRLLRPLRARRDKSADAQGRLGVQAVAAALQQFGTQHQPDTEALHIVADADHRASRGGELYESVSAVWPALDPMLAITRVGQGCGDLGVAGALVPCALASAWLRTAEPAPPAASGASPTPAAGPMALALNLQSSHERVIVPLAPWRRAVSAPEPQARAAS